MGIVPAHAPANAGFTTKKERPILERSFLTNLLFIKKLAVGEGVEPSRGS